MKAALKIELYDAGVVLFNSPKDFNFEFTGFDYSDNKGSIELSGLGLGLIKDMGLITPEILNNWDDYPNSYILRHSLSREILCVQLLAEEKPTEILTIEATCFSTGERENEAKHWSVSCSYRGSYSVFWDFNNETEREP